MVTTLHLKEDAKISKKLTVELLQNSMDNSVSKVALMQIRIAFFSLHSCLSVDRAKNDNGVDVLAVSEYHDKPSGFKICDVYKSQLQTHRCFLLLNNHLKCLDVKKPTHENLEVVFVVIKSRDTEFLVNSECVSLSDENNFLNLMGWFNAAENQSNRNDLTGRIVLGDLNTRHTAR